MHGECVVVTGVTGQIAFPLAAHLAQHNEVWGVARFGDPEQRARVEAAGIRAVPLDLASGDLGALPREPSYVVHLAAFQGSSPDYDHALAVNAEGTGLLLAHCRTAKAALVMSTGSVYRPHDEPFHRYVETDPLGDSGTIHAPTYAISKIGQEAVARFCARAYGLPVTIARMNAAYGPNGGLPHMHLDAIARGEPVIARVPDHRYSPIHEDDIAWQLDALLDAADVPATIVNWGGDEPVSLQAWCAHLGALLGRDAVVEVVSRPGTRQSNAFDSTKRIAITGPCRVAWQDGMRSMVDALDRRSR
jgi:nucleoside-diphosphate-sugar epimerase